MLQLIEFQNENENEHRFSSSVGFTRIKMIYFRADNLMGTSLNVLIESENLLFCFSTRNKTKQHQMNEHKMKKKKTNSRQTKCII